MTNRKKRLRLSPNTIVTCPFCGKPVKGRDFAVHVRGHEGG